MNWNKVDGLFSGVITIAILAVVVGTRSQTTSVITAIGKSLSGILGVVVSPVTDNGAAASAAAATTGSAGSGGTNSPGASLINSAISAAGGSALSSGLASNIIGQLV